MEIKRINNYELSVKEYKNQRVVTFKDIDTVHGRPEGTAKRNFDTNRKHFIEGEDFFLLKPLDSQKDENRTLEIPNRGLTVLTESGYLMLVKSFTDDLAWSVQRQLVKNYFRDKIFHCVKVLTVTSRDICKMLGHSRTSHTIILREIRDCIRELEEMGFNTSDFFIESKYEGANGKIRTEFRCTERGCEYFSGRLEPSDRKMFITEFKDRFERLRGVLNGDPVKGISEHNRLPESETIFRIYENNQWGLLLLDDELYNLSPEEMKIVKSVTPMLIERGVNRVKTVIQTYLENSRQNGKVEKIAEYRCPSESGPPANQRRGTTKK